MKEKYRNLIKVVLVITILLMMTVTTLIISIKKPVSAGSTIDPELNSPFIVFAPGFGTLLQSGY